MTKPQSNEAMKPARCNTYLCGKEAAWEDEMMQTRKCQTCYDRNGWKRTLMIPLKPSK